MLLRPGPFSRIVGYAPVGIDLRPPQGVHTD